MAIGTNVQGTNVSAAAVGIVGFPSNKIGALLRLLRAIRGGDRIGGGSGGNGGGLVIGDENGGGFVIGDGNGGGLMIGDGNGDGLMIGDDKRAIPDDDIQLTEL